MNSVIIKREREGTASVIVNWLTSVNGDFKWKPIRRRGYCSPLSFQLRQTERKWETAKKKTFERINTKLYIFFCCCCQALCNVHTRTIKIKEHSIEWSNEEERKRAIKSRETKKRWGNVDKKATEKTFLFFQQRQSEYIYELRDDLTAPKSITERNKWSMHRWMGIDFFLLVESTISWILIRAINVEFKVITNDTSFCLKSYYSIFFVFKV